MWNLRDKLTKDSIIYALTVLILVIVIYYYSLEPFDNAATYSNFDRVPQSKHASRSMADNVSKFILEGDNTTKTHAQAFVSAQKLKNNQALSDKEAMSILKVNRQMMHGEKVKDDTEDTDEVYSVRNT